MTHPRATWPTDNPSPSSGKATGSIVPLSTTAKAVALTNASTQRCPPARLGSVGSLSPRGSIRFPRRPRPSCFSRSGEVPATFGRLTKGVQECLLRERRPSDPRPLLRPSDQAARPVERLALQAFPQLHGAEDLVFRGELFGRKHVQSFAGSDGAGCLEGRRVVCHESS